MTAWDVMDSDLLFTEAPFGSIRIVRLSGMIVVVMLCTICAPYYALSVLYSAGDIKIAEKPDFYSVEVFDNLTNASPSVTTMRLFLWSGPLYSALLFAASVDKSVIQSYPFVIKKYILRRHVGANPDPSPGIDLSTLTPAPMRKRIHRRVIRKSRQYDPPLSALDFDIPLPPRPPPGYRATAALPPVPAPTLIPNEEPRRPEPAYVGDVRRARRKKAQRRGNIEFEKAMRHHVEANMKFPLYNIPEAASLDENREEGEDSHPTRDEENGEQSRRTLDPNDRLFRYV